MAVLRRHWSNGLMNDASRNGISCALGSSVTPLSTSESSVRVRSTDENIGYGENGQCSSPVTMS